MSTSNFLSICTVTSIGLACKAFLNLGFCSSVSVTGMHHLLTALQDGERAKGRGVVTVSNHTSVLDDPVTWGVLPLRCYWNLRDMRWALGASDIMFTNPVFSSFFRRGQVLETFRGQGIYQPAVDTAIVKLNEGRWVHLFGEGKVNQPYQYPVNDDGVARLPRFKWGTARIIMETQHLPTIIPMWLSGLEDVMPEPRGFPQFLPRLRKRVRITFGPPVDPAHFAAVLAPWRARALHSPDNISNSVNDNFDKKNFDSNFDNNIKTSKGDDGEVPLGRETEEKRRVRIALTEIIQREVEQLGREVSGPLLGGPGRSETRTQRPRP